MTFGLDGITYEIDLTEAHIEKLNVALAPYVRAARRNGRKTGTTATSQKTHRAELQTIREWARENGHAVSDRGRVPSSIRDAYIAAN